jgi:hypothetical protein
MDLREASQCRMQQARAEPIYFTRHAPVHTLAGRALKISVVLTLDGNPLALACDFHPVAAARP